MLMLKKLYDYRRKCLFLYFFTKLKNLLEKNLHFNNQTGILYSLHETVNKQNKRKNKLLKKVVDERYNEMYINKSLLSDEVVL